MIAKLLGSTIGQLRILAFLEGLSFLALIFVTMPLKYMMEMPMPNKIGGMIHGFLFIAYVIYVVLCHLKYEWGNNTTLWALLASIVPFGTFVADEKLFRGYE